MTKTDRRDSIILVASEPLTFEKAEWVEIPCQTMIVITANVCLPVLRLFFAQAYADELAADPDCRPFFPESSHATSRFELCFQQGRLLWQVRLAILNQQYSNSTVSQAFQQALYS